MEDYIKVIILGYIIFSGAFVHCFWRWPSFLAVCGVG